MNATNYIDWTEEKFIDALEGKDSAYIQKDDSQSFIDQKAYTGTRLVDDPANKYSIYIPNKNQRYKHKRAESYYTNQAANYSDSESQIVNRIPERVTWNRYVNLGEGSKSTLSFGINLLNCEFHNTFSILNVRSNGNLVIDNCAFVSSEHTDKDLEIYCSKFDSVDIIDSTKTGQEKNKFSKEINIISLETNRLLISGLTIEKLIIDCDHSYIDQITIHECTISYVEIKGHKVGSIFFSNTHVTRSLQIDIRIKHLLITSFNIADSEKNVFSEIHLNLYNDEEKGEYTIQDITIDLLTISGVNSKKFLIKDCEIRTLSFDHLSNWGDLRLQSIHKIINLSINSSSLGRTEFLNIDLSASIQTEVIDSNLLDVVFINTTLPDDLIARTKDDYNGIREVFRQLKVSSGRQGNRIQELKYKALEMNAYQNDKVTIKTTDEKFILWVNKLTNNYGQSWSKAALVLSIVTFLLFKLIKAVFGYTYSLEFSSYEVSQYLEFAVNPLHNFETIFEAEINYNPSHTPLAKIIDVFSKLLEGLLLFQTISAFRKYVR